MRITIHLFIYFEYFEIFYNLDLNPKKLEYSNIRTSLVKYKI